MFDKLNPFKKKAEPKKVAKKKEVAAPSANEADLASIVDDWDD
mgnify:CR=1 FL=1